MERTLRVTGSGKVSVKPDTTRIIMTVEGKEKDYCDALRASSEMTEDLKKTLEPFGFERKSVRTLHFDVETVYENYRDRNNDYRQRFKGYRFSHRLKLEFPSDNELLGRLLYALAHCEAKPELRFEYAVRDPEPVRNELLARAVADSRAKAAVLSAAAGVSLGEILTVDYSWGEIDFVTRPMNDLDFKMACCEPADACPSYDLDVEADEIEHSDHVTVVWRIA